MFASRRTCDPRRSDLSCRSHAHQFGFVFGPIPLRFFRSITSQCIFPGLTAWVATAFGLSSHVNSVVRVCGRANPNSLSGGRESKAYPSALRRGTVEEEPVFEACSTRSAGHPASALIANSSLREQHGVGGTKIDSGSSRNLIYRGSPSKCIPVGFTRLLRP